MLKVHQNISPRFGRGIQRVAQAIQTYAPKERVTFDTMVDDDTDIVIHHVIGVQNFHPTHTIDQLVEMDAKNERSSVVVQYCLSTTENPDPLWWQQKVWAYCNVVWSYYDLAGMLDRQVSHTQEALGIHYEAPLGVDPVFYGSLGDRPRHPIFVCCTSGHISETEGVLEVVEAAARAGGRVLHLGPKSLMLGHHVSYVENVSDAELAALYKTCKYVAGLRRVEGFELPAAEGLCGGAIPILFNQPHYSRWFETAGLYVGEVDSDAVREQIEQIFRYSQRTLSPVDVIQAQQKFSWPRVVDGFWKRIFKGAHDGTVQES